MLLENARYYVPRSNQNKRSILTLKEVLEKGAVQMQTVCRAKHADFLKALEGLPTEKKEWLTKHVFNVDECQALALPEAD